MRERESVWSNGSNVWLKIAWQVIVFRNGVRALSVCIGYTYSLGQGKSGLKTKHNVTNAVSPVPLYSSLPTDVTRRSGRPTSKGKCQGDGKKANMLPRRSKQMSREFSSLKRKKTENSPAATYLASVRSTMSGLVATIPRAARLQLVHRD